VAERERFVEGPRRRGANLWRAEAATQRGFV